MFYDTSVACDRILILVCYSDILLDIRALHDVRLSYFIGLYPEFTLNGGRKRERGISGSFLFN